MSNGINPSHFHMDRCRAAEAMVSIAHIRQVLDYDAETGHLLWRERENRNFNVKYAGTRAGALHRSGAIQVQIRFEGFCRLMWAHRIAWVHHHGSWPDGLIDHRDGCPSNNRITNLRVANGCQNGANKRELRGAIPFKGVYLTKDGKFAAQIKFEGKWKWLGLHDDEVSAAKAYDAGAMNLHGEFATTNRSMGLFRRYEIARLA